jgi:hypothetical protein
LGAVPKSGEANEIVERALAYPHPSPTRSFVQLGARTLEFAPGAVDLRGRLPLLAYGSNASPQVLARKLAALPELPLPVFRAELGDFDVVYSAHVSPRGAVPATLRPSPGTTLATFVAYPTEQQLRLLAGTEPNYELGRLTARSCRLEEGPEPTDLSAFLGRYGCLEIDGAPIALAAIAARGRVLSERDEPAMLEHVRAMVAPDLTLEDFVLGCVASGGLAPLDRGEAP